MIILLNPIIIIIIKVIIEIRFYVFIGMAIIIGWFYYFLIKEIY